MGGTMNDDTSLDDLTGAIVKGMYDSEHHITDALLANYRQQVEELQFRLDRVQAIVDDAEVIDRTTRTRLFTALHGSLPADLFGAVSS